MLEAATATETKKVFSLEGPILLFGNGPVIDKEKRIKAEHAGTILGQEDVPFLSEILTEAAAILHEKYPKASFIVLGGRTGGQQYSSEAELFRNKMLALGISSENIQLEQESRDTVENLINFINQYTSPDASIAHPKVSVIGMSSHLVRIGILMRLLAIPIKYKFAAEEVLKYKARSFQMGELTDDSSQWNTKMLEKMESMLDMTDTKELHPFWREKKGEDRNITYDRTLADNIWIREVLTYPARILYPAAGIKSDIRLREIVKRAFLIHPKEEMAHYDIDLTRDDSETLRAKLRKLPWPFLTPNEKENQINQWKKENISSGWPESLNKKFDIVMSLT